MADLADYAWLAGDSAAAWLRRLADDARPELQLLDSLRRDLSSERARLVVEQLALRRRAADKFGERAARMLFTRVHLEQATDLWIARYKASRLTAPRRPVIDGCCGIGGDLVAVSEAGEASGWDRSELACLLAQANLEGAARVRCGDVASITPDAEATWHLDPDRRADGRRSTMVAHYEPGPDLVERWQRSCPRGAVKLAPAAVAPPEWSQIAEREWITRDRQCRQQVAWFGPLTAEPGRRRATVVSRDGTVASLAGDLAGPCESRDDPGAFLYDPDPSILAASLLGSLAALHGLASLGAGGAYLTGDARVETPLAAGLHVHDCLPLRKSSLASHLVHRGIGRVEIKKRGVSIEPEALRRQLKLRGDNAATLVLTRIGKREVAIVGERFSP